ncbi:glycosyltransferase [Alicyclobacillus vulcanalis]|uniref:Hopene-associated glycosyltransferase HpnB n=1 Tax=Alicyclobacillus vulcanalis TaxID=252246 RepID=A0A1N7MD90_9BACL|nr:glycosyltransferase [Alicyclobacillus vulcanalis]SIS84000.1 hopene-associated glycosyltransferase HpnB [Alicyclobacillus vulcanalis]
MIALAWIAAVSLAAWLFLLLARGLYWRMHLAMDTKSAAEEVEGEGARNWPAVCAVVPARNEADVLPRTLPALLSQAYPGRFQVILVDDHSDDGTAQVAMRAAAEMGASDRLRVVAAEALPAGWTGKVWAMQNGLKHVPDDAEYILFTDADILHPPTSVTALVAAAERRNLDLVSLMVRLRAESAWEKLLIPAFVYFFAKLYPFAWVADPRKKTAAAAGGCVLVRRSKLPMPPGLTPIQHAMIDDCALAQLVADRGGRLWLGLGIDVVSLRAYQTLGEIWRMIARTAFVQLRFSALLLAGTALGMLLLYVVPPMALLAGLVGAWSGARGGLAALALGGLAYAILAGTFIPILRFYRLSAARAILLPLAGALYTLMTLDSARRFWLRTGDHWKGRPYEMRKP